MNIAGRGNVFAVFYNFIYLPPMAALCIERIHKPAMPVSTKIIASTNNAAIKGKYSLRHSCKVNFLLVPIIDKFKIQPCRNLTLRLSANIGPKQWGPDYSTIICVTMIANAYFLRQFHSGQSSQVYCFNRQELGLRPCHQNSCQICKYELENIIKSLKSLHIEYRCRKHDVQESENDTYRYTSGIHEFDTCFIVFNPNTAL